MTEGLRHGTRLQGGKYRIERVLGAGSFGITYLATAKVITQGNLGTMEVEAKVAIKEFFMRDVNTRRNDGSTIEGSTGSVFTNYRKKFKREAENLSKLSHPNIVKVFDVFDENNTTYYVMDFIEGENLDEYISRKGKLSEQRTISIITEIGKALEYLHSRKMLHLDIKPKNIMCGSNGMYYLIDFGLSKQFTDDGEPESSTTIGLGTPGYAPVEQAAYRQDGTFPETLDVYALGATMFKMLTGKRPPEATFVLNDGFPKDSLAGLGVSDRTVKAVESAMAPLRKNRSQNVKVVIGNLKEVGARDDEDESTVFEDTGSSISSQEEWERPLSQSKPRSNRKWIFWGVGIMAVIVIGIMLWVKSGIDNSASTANAVTDSKEVLDANGHEYVDLGLPSGVKWATCNVGASNPWEYGDYFAWGEVSPKSIYTRENCKTFGKNIGDISGNPEYDAARANWGGSWRMPTREESHELSRKCSWTWTENNGIKGYKIVGTNGNSIFLPAAGDRIKEFLDYVGENGSYWSSTPAEGNTENAYDRSFGDKSYGIYDIPRFYGQSVRPVTN